MKTGEHQRRSVRLPGQNYSDPGAYFVTIVSDRRRLLFGQVSEGQIQLSKRGLIVAACWREIPDHFPQVELGTFIVMPNHVHGILILHDRAEDPDALVGARHAVPTGACHGMPLRPSRFGKPQKGSLATILGHYKAAVTRRVHQQFGDTRIWQRGYYEHVIRDEGDWNRIHLYIESNPCNWDADEENQGVIVQR